MEECPFTGVEARQPSGTEAGIKTFESDGCGSFSIHNSALDAIRGDLRPSPQALVNCGRRCLEVSRGGGGRRAFWILRRGLEASQGAAAQRPDLVPIAIEGVLEEQVDHSSKPIFLLEVLASRLDRRGAFTSIRIGHEDRVWARVAAADELLEIRNHLVHRGLLKLGPESRATADTEWERVLSTPVRMTVDGWAEIRERLQAANSNKVFIATQFAWPDGEEGLRVQAITAIQNACRACGYEASVVSQDHTDFITDRIIAEIKRSRFVVAELSYNNRGVYFEAGLARGLGIPVFHVVREDHTRGNDVDGKKIHFDIAQIRYQPWTTPDGLEVSLRDWIEARLGRHRV